MFFVHKAGFKSLVNRITVSRRREIRTFCTRPNARAERLPSSAKFGQAELWRRFTMIVEDGDFEVRKM